MNSSVCCFGKTLKECRAAGLGHPRRLAWTQQNLADGIGRGVNAVQNYEACANKPPAFVFEKIVVVFSEAPLEAVEQDLLDRLKAAYANWPGACDETETPPSAPAGRQVSPRLAAAIGAASLAVAGGALFLLLDADANASRLKAESERYLAMFESPEDAYGAARIRLRKELSSRDAQIIAFREWAETHPRHIVEKELLNFGANFLEGAGGDHRNRADFELVLEFFEQTDACIRADRCDRDVLIGGVGPYAVRLCENFGLYATQRRSIAPGYGEALAAFAEIYAGDAGYCRDDVEDEG